MVENSHFKEAFVRGLLPSLKTHARWLIDNSMTSNQIKKIVNRVYSAEIAENQNHVESEPRSLSPVLSRRKRKILFSGNAGKRSPALELENWRHHRTDV